MTSTGNEAYREDTISEYMHTRESTVTKSVPLKQKLLDISVYNEVFYIPLYIELGIVGSP